MTDAQRLLELIEERINEHGGDLGGWTKLEDEQLQLFDGRVTLTATIHEDDDQKSGTVHSHLYATLHDYDDEVLDACVFGVGETREDGIAQAAMIWMTCVAGPIRSFLDNKPVCMTCQAGVVDGDVAAGFAPGDYGLHGVRAYVGPSIGRGFSDQSVVQAIDDTKPWFRFATASAAPRRVHLAKATIYCEGKNGWSRELEIDGHEVSHSDPGWPAGVQGPKFGYLTRFAVFEFPLNSSAIQQRAELDRTIEHFIHHIDDHETVEELEQSMVSEGFDPQLVHEVESISTIAFGRMMFEQYGVQYPSTVIRAREDGTIETDIPVASLPAYSRGRAKAGELFSDMNEAKVQTLCLYNAESQAILLVLDSAGTKPPDWDQVTLYPSIVPDLNINDETMLRAREVLDALVEKNQKARSKPWWKFW